MLPAAEVLAAYLVDHDARSDSRAAARTLPLTEDVVQAVHDILGQDLQPVLSAVDTPTSRHFRLALSAFIASFEVTFSALLAEQREHENALPVSDLYIYVTAAHFCVLHPLQFSALWQRSGPRVDSLFNSLADLLCTFQPPASAADITSVGKEPGALADNHDHVRTAVFIRRVQLALPDHHALHRQFARINSVQFSVDERSIYFFQCNPDVDITEAWSIEARHEFDHAFSITMCGGQAYSLHCAASLAPLRLQLSRKRRLLPAELHWSEQTPCALGRRQREASPPEWFALKLARRSTSPPPRRTVTTIKKIPDFHITRVISKRSAWFRRFKHHLGQAARVILDGRLTIPMECHEGPPLDSPNMKTCFDSPDHTRFVDNIISEYLVTGVVSWYPPHAKPIAICPIGVVPKKTEPYFRLVIDARGPNDRTSRWGSNMKSLASSPHIFEEGSVGWSLDVGKAYVINCLMGCRRAFTKRMRSDGFKYEHIGCEPDNCSLGCSKCILGFRWRGQYFVFNAPMFGAKVSGNILDTLLAPLDRWIRSSGIAMLRWCDDYLFMVPPLPEHRHDTSFCGGIGACVLCNCTRDRAAVLRRKLYSLMEELGFTFSGKDSPLAQRGQFIGLGWDSLKMVFWMAPEKAEKILSLIEPIVDSKICTRRLLAQLRGRLIWFSPCLFGVRLLTRALNAFIGNPDSDAEWDAFVPVPASVLEELQHWAAALPTMSCHERAMSTLKPQQVLELYRLGRRVVQVYMETDASIYGWGCIIRYLSDDVWEELRTGANWDSDQPVVQVQCEAEGLFQSLKAFLAIVKHKAVLHVTDCLPTLGLPERGSPSSAQLQLTALRIWFFCSFYGIFLTSAWTPGDDMVKSGCDALSRELLADPHCAFLLPNAWQVVLDLSRKFDRTPVVDWFADNINHQLDNFWSRSSIPGAAGSDALAAPSWNHLRCPNCDSLFVTFGYFFPPVPLLDRVILKAKQDQASGALVVPRLISSVWWPVLSAAAISPFVRLPAGSVNCQREHCSPTYRNYVWNVVIFDFAPLPRSTLLVQPCQCLHTVPTDSAKLSQAQEFRNLHAKLAGALLQS